MRFNEGRAGVPLDKLERIATETRKFLESIASDLDLPEDIKWLGSKFRNQSLSYDVEGNHTVEVEKSREFNSAITELTKGNIPPFITRESAGKFYAIAKPLEADERVRFGVYNGNARPHWYELRPGTTPTDAAPILGAIQYVGAIQGTLHSWYKGASEPYFYLRDAVTHFLVKCEYSSDSVYDQLAQAVQKKDNIIHAHGEITADRERRTIESVRVDKLAWFKPFSMRDVNEYLDSGNVQ